LQSDLQVLFTLAEQHGLLQLDPHCFLPFFAQHCLLQSDLQVLFTLAEQHRLLQSVLHALTFALQHPGSPH